MNKYEPESSSFLLNQIVGDQSSQEWLSTSEAASLLSITPNALRIMVYRDQIKAYKFGSRLRFRRQDCLALFVKKGA